MAKKEKKGFICPVCDKVIKGIDIRSIRGHLFALHQKKEGMDFNINDMLEKVVEVEATDDEPKEKKDNENKEQPEKKSRAISLPLKKTTGTTISRGFQLNAEELARAERMIKWGFASNLDQLIRRFINFNYEKANEEGDNMAKEEDPIAEMRKRRMQDIELEKMERSLKADASQNIPAKKDFFEELLDMKKHEMQMKLLENQGKAKDSGGGGFNLDMGQIMQFMFLEKMMDKSKPQTDPEIKNLLMQMMQSQSNMQKDQELKLQLQEFKNSLPKNDSTEKMITLMMQQNQNQMNQLLNKNQNIDPIQLITLFRQQDKEGQGVVMEFMKDRINELSRRPDKIGELKELVGLYKGMKGAFGDKEDTKWDAMGKIIGDTAEKISPAVQSYFENKAQSRSMPQQQSNPNQFFIDQDEMQFLQERRKKAEQQQSSLQQQSQSPAIGGPVMPPTESDIGIGNVSNPSENVSDEQLSRDILDMATKDREIGDANK